MKFFVNYKQRLQNYYQTIQHCQRANQKRLTLSAFISSYINLFRELLPNNTHFVRVHTKQYYIFRELIQNNNTHFLRVHIKLYWHIQRLFQSSYQTILTLSDSYYQTILWNSLFVKVYFNQYWYIKKVESNYQIIHTINKALKPFNDTSYQKDMLFKEFFQNNNKWTLLKSNTHQAF